jgi:AraC family transcriptional regulator, transcriptional activator of the genes for pyochelin and ferripyochelin receptors
MDLVPDLQKGSIGVYLSMENDRTSSTWECDGIKLGHAVSRFNGYTSFAASGAKDVVRLHFGMKGNYSFYYQQLGKTYDLIGGHHNIMYSSHFDMVVYNRSLELETFGVQFPVALFIQFTQNANDALKRFAQGILEGKSVLFSEEWGAIDPSIEQVIRQVTQCKYGGDLKQLFLLSKSIELLVLSAEACTRSAHTKGQYLKTKADQEKIMAVRDLVNERVQCPPSLSEIARLVGLNEYKLKRGFKETFHTTVFGYLTEQRLDLARRFLSDTDKTAAEIAIELGYASPQHFNNAFKKKFGLSPQRVRNNP